VSAEPDDHLSELALARLLIDGAAQPAHVAGCARCQRVLDDARAQTAAFARQVFPRTLPRIEARLTRRRVVWFASAAFAALAAAVAVDRGPSAVSGSDRTDP